MKVVNINNANDIYKIDDWRIMGQPGYLFQKRLYKRSFIPNFDDKHPDHAHCEFCNDYFCANDKQYLHEGYYEPINHCWICETCYNDFKELFQWIIEDTIL
jgi:hypothetical protein